MNEIKAYYALTQKTFHFLAPFYDLMTLPLILVRKQVVDFVNVTADSSILDVATGTGQQAFAFAKRGSSVIGVDLTEARLEIAGKHNKGDSVKFEIGDATHLQFEDSAFDVTCISFALHDMPTSIREQVLNEMVRVTKPNGLIVIVDYDLPRNRISKALAYWFITLYEGEYYKQFIASDICELLEKTGIQIIKEHTILLGAGKMYKGFKRTNPAKTLYPALQI